MQWHWTALVFVSYLALVSLSSEFVRARAPLATAAAIAWVLQAIAAGAHIAGSSGIFAQIVLPTLVLVLGYWLSGLLFVRVDLRSENWLRAVDECVLLASGLLDRYRRSPRIVREYFELSYLLVYPMVPAGAATLLFTGHADQIGKYWTVVLLAAFSCYAALPWVQTRPPRVHENLVDQSYRDPLRRISLAVTERASIKANTVPSGHAAGAVAAALAVWSTAPYAGVIFLVLALSIAIATVLGRYHYLVDTVLGVLVAILAWGVVEIVSPGPTCQ